jgi:hypothetical protein
MAAAAVLTAACSGSPSATGSGGSSAVGAGSGGSSTQAALVAYASCMRAHGVPDFPDPAGSGGIPKPAVISALSGVSSSQAQAAQVACAHLLPAGDSLGGQPSRTVTAQQQLYYLKAAACMRSHGITNFPDPAFPGGQVKFPDLRQLVDVSSPQFTQARLICQKLIPAGLPYSGSSG